MKKTTVALLTVVFIVLCFGCYTPDLDRPSLTRYVTLKVFGDSTNVTINGEEDIDLTASPYESRVKLVAEKQGDDPFFEEWVFPSVALTVEDFSGGYTLVNAEIWDEKTGQIEASGIITEPFEAITIAYKPDLRP